MNSDPSSGVEDIFGDSSDGEEQPEPVLATGTCRKFTDVQTAKLIALYNSGLKGVGQQYAPLLSKAADETGLSVKQVKVRLAWVLHQ